MRDYKEDLKQVRYASFIWKGEKRKEGNKYVQDSIKMIDMTPEQLVAAYKRCKLMLNNDDIKNLGRYNVLKEVNNEIKNCNIELLLRYYENTYKTDSSRPTVLRESLNMDLRAFKAHHPDIEDWSKFPISRITDELPVEFYKLNIADILDGCIDYLGAFNKQHLTMTFITKMGLWFTKAEESELGGTSNLDRLKIAKERLHLPKELVLRFNERGLSYKEMRAILILPKRQKYSDMTTEQLVTLKTKILPRLQKEIDQHIFNWNRLMQQLELVAKSKEIDLNG